MSAPELKPCPFCGGVPYLANKEMPGGAFVVCTDCRAATDDGCIDTAIERWNIRADLAPAAPKVKALVDAAKEAVEALDYSVSEIADLENTLSNYRQNWQPAAAALSVLRAALAALEEQ